jgi:hypothetical protein
MREWCRSGRTAGLLRALATFALLGGVETLSADEPAAAPPRWNPFV